MDISNAEQACSACNTDNAPTAARELSVGQRVAHRLLGHFAGDLDRGSVAEQHTAALLRLVADAIERGYEAELVGVARDWRRGVEV